MSEAEIRPPLGRPGPGRWAAALYEFLARRRLLLIGLVAAGLGLAFWQTTNIRLDKSLQPLLPDSSPSLQRSVELLDLAPFARVMLVQLTAETAEALPELPAAADTLTAGLDRNLSRPVDFEDGLPEAAELMALLPALCDADCRAGLTESLEPRRLRPSLEALKIQLAGPAGAEAYFWRADPLNWRPELFRRFPSAGGWPRVDPLTGYPLSRDGRHLLIILRPLVSMNDTAGAILLMDDLEARLAELPPGLSAQVVGAHRHTAANASVIEGDLALTLSLALLLILGIYLFLVRSFGSLWLFLTPTVAVLIAAAALNLAFAPVSALALGFGAAVLGIAEDYAVHVHFALRRAPQKTAALEHVARPLLMSVILCVAGFAVLMLSSVPAIRQLAFFSAAAIIVGYVWALAVLPHCPGMDLPRETPNGALRRRDVGGQPSAEAGPELQSPPQEAPNGALRRRDDHSISSAEAGPELQSLPNEAPDGALRRRDDHSSTSAATIRSVPLRLTFLTLAGGCVLLAGLMPLNASIRDLGLSGREILKDQQSVEANWQLDGGRRVYLAEGEDFSQALVTAGALAAELNAAVPGSASSLAPLLPAPEVQRANLAAWRLWQRDVGAALPELLAEAGGRDFAPRAFAPFLDWVLGEPRPIDPGRLDEIGLGALTDGFLAEKNGRAFALVVAENRAPEPGPEFLEKVVQISASEMEKGLSRALSGEKSLLPLCGLICLTVLLVAFRNIDLALAAFIPALGGLAAVLLIQLMLGRPLGLAEAAALPLVICLGADYGIVVVSEFRAQADLGAPKAIFVSGLSTIAGIGILILAQHPVLHSLGQTVFAGLAAAMPISILLIPKMWKS